MEILVHQAQIPVAVGSFVTLLRKVAANALKILVGRRVEAILIVAMDRVEMGYVIRPTVSPTMTIAPVTMIAAQAGAIHTMSVNNDPIDSMNGDILWHAGLADNLSNGPITYTLDGQQYLVAGAGDSLYAFSLQQ